MNIFAIGDVVGSPGCKFVRDHLSSIKKLKNIHLVVANGENSADGNGISPDSANHLFDSGVDVITSGNHVWRRKEIHSMLDENPFLTRPANYPENAPGKGISIVDKGRVIVAVINLMGVVYMDSLNDPFLTADRIVEEAKERGAKIILLDFHAEATAEKRALGFYLDGRISALFGTHTHVATADEQIFPQGMGYITDLGMTGPADSVLGVKPELAIEKMKGKLPVRFSCAEGGVSLSGCIFTIDDSTGKTTCVERVEIK